MVIQRLFFVSVWNGKRFERESDETFTDPALAFARCAELVRSGRDCEDVAVDEVSEEVAVAS